MVGSLMLLKMLHCSTRRLRRGSTSSHAASPSGLSTVKAEKQGLNDQDRYICRVCLKNGNIPIYGKSKSIDIPENLSVFGGIEVKSDDVYPKYLCKSCHALLEGAILLRKTAQQSNQVLRESIQDENTVNEDYDDYDMVNIEDDVSYDNKKKENVMSLEIKDTEKNYHCRKCNLDYKTYKEYEDHRMSDEHENRKLACPVCNQLYVDSYLKKHMLLHSVESRFMCDICGRKFVIQSLFTRHRLTHFNDLPFKCAQCPYRGRFRESLKMHMRSHTGYKPHQCPHCPSRFFVNKSNLSRHLLTHKADHDFKCDLCQRGFYTKRELDAHFKVDHSGIKEHPCDVCGKVFGYRKQMMKHQLKVHKRQKLLSGRAPLYLRAEKGQEEES